MSDLISRKAVYEMLHNLGGCDATDEHSQGWDKAIDVAIKELFKIPIAYDVEKVISQLLNKMFLAEYYSDDFSGCKINNLLCMGDVYEIVKGAVKDE